jgi:ribosomal protein S27AE
MIEPGDLEQLRRHLKRCPVCRSKDLIGADHIVAISMPPERKGETTLLAPLIAVRCGRCGFVALFDPATVGIALRSTITA